MKGEFDMCALADNAISRGRETRVFSNFVSRAQGLFRSNRYADDEDKQRTVYNCCPPMAASPAGSKGQPCAVL